MKTAIPNLVPVIPEIFVLFMACIALLADLFVQQPKKTLTYVLVQVGLIGAAIFTIILYNQPTTYTFSGMFVHDKIASLLKLAIYLTSFLAFLYSRQYLQENKIKQAEYYVLGLFAVLGMMVLVSGNSLLVIFLGLELLSLPIYAMVALQRKSPSASEAAMKYYVMGAMATGILLYGMSMIYGASDSLNIDQIAKSVMIMPASQQLILIFALAFVVVGIAFKLGAAPFHMWAPDVYQGAPAPVTLFITSAPKIAILGMAIRLLIQALPSLDLQWQQLLIVTALLSMAWGNIAAIMQTNLKRMLAYSSVAHMGYMSLGLLAATDAGYSAAMFYMLIYALMSIGAFAVIIILSKAGVEAENISDLQGLNTRSPWLALMMLFLMFSMAGIPPLVGFFAKLGVLEALVSAHLVWLAALALIFAVVGSYYYLAIVKVMYFEEPQVITPVLTSNNLRIVLSVNSIAVLLLGIFPTAFIDLCRAAF